MRWVGRGEENRLWNEVTQLLVGGFNAAEKYARQIGSFPQVGVKIKNP